LRDSYESFFPDKAVYFAGCLFLSAFALLGGYYYVDVGKQLYQEMSTRAKIQAEEIALIPTLRNEVEQKDISAIHDFMQKIAPTVTPALL
jgi:sensor histidine kinase regulating citrate/malate metabolism